MYLVELHHHRTVPQLTPGFMGLYGLDWSGSGKGPVEGSCEHGNESSGSITFSNILSSWGTVGFLGRTHLHGVRLLNKSFWVPPRPGIWARWLCWPVLCMGLIWSIIRHWCNGITSLNLYHCKCDLGGIFARTELGTPCLVVRVECNSRVTIVDSC
jgi:hypothetical protein